MKYEEWRDEIDEEELEFERRQERARYRYRLMNLYNAVGAFEPKWKDNIHFFDAKAMQDKGFTSIYEN